jgi:hypothetical protein
MLTRRICYDNDKDDRMQERIKDRAAAEPATPVTAEQLAQLQRQYTPEPQPVKIRKRRRSRSIWA